MSPNALIVTMEGEEIREGKVPIKILSEVLRGLQETVYSIASAELGRDARKKLRLPDNIREELELYRVLERPGSYEIVLAMREPLQPYLLPETNLQSITLEKYVSLVRFLEAGEFSQISALFPDSIHRRRILRSIESYAPRLGDRWRLVVKDHKGRTGTIDVSTRKTIGDLVAQPEVGYRTVTGQLVRLHLDENKLAILYEPTGRVLDCFYDPELEDFIIKNIGDIIHVTGLVQLDADDQPVKIVDVKEISMLDLRPVRLTAVETPDATIEFKAQLEVVPRFEEQEVVLEIQDLNLIAAGATREEAIRELEADLVWLWLEYGEANDEELSLDGQKLKRKLLELIREVKTR